MDWSKMKLEKQEGSRSKQDLRDNRMELEFHNNNGKPLKSVRRDET